MANPITQIILTAVDRTKAAFASAKGGIDSIGSAATGVSGLLRNLFAGLSVVGWRAWAAKASLQARHD